MDDQSLFDRLWAKKITFFVTFFVVFTATYLLLVAIDFVPEPPAAEVETEEIAPESNVAVEPTELAIAATEMTEPTVFETILPNQLYIEKLDKTIPVLNPTSRTITDLDEALLSGVVRHPDSATLAQDGNVFILGHSSYLPNVLNENFQAFNGIQNLEWGDEIEVSSGDQVFVYRVEKVYQAKAQDVTVPIAGEEKLLTLATCNSFGSIDDRYIVEARQIEVRTL